MDGSLMLILLSVTMFVGSFVSGLIPLTLTLSENKMRLITLIGAGLLVGTALAVIIPEGVHTLYKNNNINTNQHDVHKRDVLPVMVEAVRQLNKRHAGHDHDHAAGDHAHDVHAHNQKLGSELLEKVKNEASQDKASSTEAHSHASGSHSGIGVTLVLGFVFMLIVDQIGGHIGPHSSSNLDGQAARNKITFTTTLGLVIHAGVDGLALGAAAASTQTDIEMIVFVAIMLHKAPASFGLVSFLLHEGLDRVRARRHLLIFALAAPIMAILTYFLLSMPNQQTIVSSNSTGLCMLFSAGTFLYVSTVHVLPEIQSHNEDKGFKFNELCCLILGAVLPLFLSVGHSH